MKRLAILAAAALALAATAGAVQWWHGRSALWRIVGEGCAPAALAGRASQCAAVVAPGTRGGYAVLKDRRGALQYLLIPTSPVSGIEDPALRAPGAEDWLADAWRERGWMDRSNGAPVPREDVALALNPRWSRSQDQLHVHISCVRADLRDRLRAADAAIGESWAPLPGGWRGHPYRVRRLVAETLDHAGVLAELGRAHAGAMGSQAVAAVGAATQGRPSFWLLETQVELGAGWLGGIEGDVQDHDCAVLGRKTGT